MQPFMRRPSIWTNFLAEQHNSLNLGAREQARFVAFESFEWLLGKWKFDEEWLDEIGKKTAEGYIKFSH